MNSLFSFSRGFLQVFMKVSKVINLPPHLWLDAHKLFISFPISQSLKFCLFVPQNLCCLCPTSIVLDSMVADTLIHSESYSSDPLSVQRASLDSFIPLSIVWVWEQRKPLVLQEYTEVQSIKKSTELLNERAPQKPIGSLHHASLKQIMWKKKIPIRYIYFSFILKS